MLIKCNYWTVFTSMYAAVSFSDPEHALVRNGLVTTGHAD